MHLAAAAAIRIWSQAATSARGNNKYAGRDISQELAESLENLALAGNIESSHSEENVQLASSAIFHLRRDSWRLDTSLLPLHVLRKHYNV